MIHHLVSTNPEDYGTIKFRSSISSLNSVIMYRVSSLSTIASFSITTDDDYMIIETTPPEPVGGEEEEEDFVEEEETVNNGETTTNEEEEEGPELIELRFQFQNHGAYELRSLAYYLNTLMTGQLVPVDERLPIELGISMDSTNRLILYADKEFTIKEASHGVRLLLGLYHSTLPISSIQKQILMPSVPYVSLGNCLYLTARTDFVSIVNTEDKEITRSIAYKVNEILYPGYPISCKIPGTWSIIHSDSLSTLEFQLVDFQLQPIKLHAPLYVSIEIQNLSNNQPDDIMKFIES